ncbi:MAG TPA: transposase [Bacteroidota bacterium]|nr:transposase [Bacteroidota bacterium]
MELYQDHYYHLYNRSNNNEVVFKSLENYLYFLKNYRKYFEVDFDTIAYCLMPTHFHFLIIVKAEDTRRIKKNLGIFLSSYTKAVNLQFERHGSLFQQHSKSRHIDDERYLLTLVTYIHQNPVRAGLVTTLEDWEFSSYKDYMGMRNGSLPKTQLILTYFSSIEEFKEYSNVMLESIERKYWV